MRLRRIALGPVELGSLSTGKSRRLSHAELEALRYAASGPREGRQKNQRKLRQESTGKGLPRGLSKGPRG
jgi:hypothetical protein